MNIAIRVLPASSRAAILMALVMPACAATIAAAPQDDRTAHPAWASGQKIFVEIVSARVGDGMPVPDLKGLLHGDLQDELRSHGFSPVASAAEALVTLEIQQVERNEIKAIVRRDKELIDSFDVNDGDCTSVWWGVESVQKANLLCHARWLAVSISGSSAFEKYVLAPRQTSPVVVASPAPVMVPAAPARVVPPVPVVGPRRLVALIPLDIHDAQIEMPVARGLEESIRTTAGDVLSPLGFTVLTGDTTLAVLADNGIDASKACETTCALATARELKADVFLSGTVGKSEGEYLAFVRVYEMKTGRQLGSVELEGTTIRQLRQQFEAKAQKVLSMAVAAIGQ